MANFDNSTTQHQSVQKANGVLPNIHAVYDAAKIVQTLMALYQAGTDATYNAAVNALFSAAERNELNQMLNGINSLVADWETNHAGALQR
jgi:hypothetical protein